jgi:hypothetical protein
MSGASAASFYSLYEKTSFKNKFKFITEDYFVQHMSITINKVKLNGNYIQKIIKGPA